jgi:hypothetical protein
MNGTAKMLWEFVPDRRNLPPVLRSLIRQPVQRVWLDGRDLVFEGLRVHDSYPNRDLKGRQLFRERRVRDRTLPVPLDEVIRVAVYPVRGGWIAGTDSKSARALYVAVDLHRVDDARTVALVDRRLGTEPEHERALAEVLRPVAGDRWADEPADGAFEIDRERLATWI